MISLELSIHDVYYFHDYVPKYRWDDWDDADEVDLSRQILNYKDFRASAMNRFNRELAEAIVMLSNTKLDSRFEKLVLVNVPPSKVGKKSPIKKSISRIVGMYEKDITENKFNKIKKVYDGGGLLIRSKDVPTSHAGKRAYDWQHELSIICERDFCDVSGNVAFLLLDDITTTGTVMEVCKNLLIDYGVEEDSIYMLAIAQTW